jgi:hypothetical protein
LTIVSTMVSSRFECWKIILFWRFHWEIQIFQNILKYSLYSFTNKFFDNNIYIFENFNISENNSSSVEFTIIPWHSNEIDKVFSPWFCMHNLWKLEHNLDVIGTNVGWLFDFFVNNGGFIWFWNQRTFASGFWKFLRI